MANLVGKMSALGMAGGVVAPLILTNPKTEKGEKVRNTAKTATGMAAIIATPFAVQGFVSRKPEVAEKVAAKAGTLIEKGLKYLADKTPVVVNKIKTSKVGKKALEVLDKPGRKVVGALKDALKKSPKAEGIVDKVVKAFKEFPSLPAVKKGRVGIAVAGVALLATAAAKLLKNYYKNEGKIEQKYEDLRAKYERWVKVSPIMDAKTGEPISFEQFCVMAQSPLK